MSEALFCAPGPILPYPTSESFPAAPLGLDVASLSLAGSRPATGRSDQGLIPLLLRPDPRLAPVTAGTEILPSAGSDVPQMGRLSDVHMMIIGRASPRRPPAVPSLDPRGQPALTAHRARRTDPDPGPHLRLWEATSLAMEFPIASCLQGTILAPTTARLPTAGSVAHGHATFWLRAAATSCRGEMNDRDEP